MKKHADSIMQSDKADYLWLLKGEQVSGELEKHHIFAGARRTMSEAQGFWVWLTNANHTASNPAENPMGLRGVHANAALDSFLKAACQREYESCHDRAEWMSLVGRNYLDDGRPLGWETWQGRDKQLLEFWENMNDEAMDGENSFTVQAVSLPEWA